MCGTKTETKTTNTYDPSSMNNYHNAQNGFIPAATDWVKHPYDGKQFNLDLQLGQQWAGGINQTGLNNLFSNMQAGGYGNYNSGLLPSMLQRQGRMNSRNNFMAFSNAMNNATQRQQFGAGLLSGVQPLQTGSDSTQTKSGLGTWLPQVIGGALGMAGGFMTGGASMAGGMAPSLAGAGLVPSFAGIPTPGGGFTGPGGGMWNGFNPMLNVSH